MLHDGLSRTNRRTAVGATFAVAAGLAIQIPTRGRVLTQRGMIGGGVVQVGQDAAEFSLYATRFELSDVDRQIVVGSIIWVDPAAGLELRTTEIVAYDVAPGDAGQTRKIEGMMSAGGEEAYPFVLIVSDVGPPNSGQDSVSFGVGDGVTLTGEAAPATGFGFSYSASGPIAAGDVQLIEFDINTETGVASAATPEA